ncbi:MAG: cytochrome c oxidase assembly protein [Rhodospirillaceae bacterium]
MSSQPDLNRRNRRTAITAFAVVAGMVGMSYAFVPLYTLICQVTGLGGTPQFAAVAPEKVSTEEITVRFDANVDASLPWSFKPLERSVTIKIGEEHLMAYQATNLAATPVHGISTFNVTPIKAAQYFTKIECFCFIEQTLEPGQTVDMPVTFFVDPAILEDELASDVKTITLSYTFYRTLDDVPLEDEPNAVSDSKTSNVSALATALSGGS